MSSFNCEKCFDLGEYSRVDSKTGVESYFRCDCEAFDFIGNDDSIMREVAATIIFTDRDFFGRFND